MSDVKPKRTSRVVVRWDGEQRFDGTRLGSEHSIHMDGTGATGPSPVDALLCALAACTGVDVASILEKRRTPVDGFSIEVVGDRADATPARLTKIVLHYRMRGAGIERVHAERAIELAVTKYCSVRDSLGSDIAVEWTLELESQLNNRRASTR